MVRLLLLSGLLYGAVNSPLPAQSHISKMAASRREEPYPQVLQIDGAVIQVDIRIGQGSLRNEDIVAWVRRAAEAVTIYYGRFPVQRTRVIVSQNEDKDESIHSTTWGDVQGVQGFTRMRLGSAVTTLRPTTETTGMNCQTCSISRLEGWRDHPVVRRGGLYEMVGARDGTQMD
jgi:hypothetical protein